MNLTCPAQPAGDRRQSIFVCLMIARTAIDRATTTSRLGDVGALKRSYRSKELAAISHTFTD